MLTSQKLVECTKCRHQFHVKADYEQYYEFSPPPLCPSPEGCSNQQFTDKEQFCKEFCIDYQVGWHEYAHTDQFTLFCGVTNIVTKMRLLKNPP